MAESDLSTEVSATTELPSPSGLSASSPDGQTEIDLSWTVNDNSSDGTIDVERSSDGGSTWANVTTGLSPSTNSYTDTSVSTGTTYKYRIERNTDHATATSETKAFELRAVTGSSLDTDSGISQVTNQRNTVVTAGGRDTVQSSVGRTRTATASSTETSAASSVASRYRSPLSTIDGISNVTVFSTVFSRVHSVTTDTGSVVSKTGRGRVVLPSTLTDLSAIASALSRVLSVQSSPTETDTATSVVQRAQTLTGSSVEVGSTAGILSRRRAVLGGSVDTSSVVSVPAIALNPVSEVTDMGSLSSVPSRTRAPSGLSTDTDSTVGETTRVSSPVALPVDSSLTQSRASRSRFPNSNIKGITNVTVFSTVYSRVHSYPVDVDGSESKTERVQTVVSNSESADSSSNSVTVSRAVGGGDPIDLSEIDDLVTNVRVIEVGSVDTELADVSTSVLRNLLGSTEDIDYVSSSPGRIQKVSGFASDTTSSEIETSVYRNVLAISSETDTASSETSVVVNPTFVVEDNGVLSVEVKEGVLIYEVPGEGTFVTENPAEGTFLTENSKEVVFNIEYENE
jgi:hypothetical protein